jgi:hypothetical protein
MPFGNAKEGIHINGTQDCSRNHMYITEDAACWMASCCTGNRPSRATWALLAGIQAILLAARAIWQHVPICWQPDPVAGRACHLAARALL